MAPIEMATPNKPFHLTAVFTPFGRSGCRR